MFANLGKSLSEVHVSLKILPYLALIKRLFNFSIALTLFLKRLQGIYSRSTCHQKLQSINKPSMYWKQPHTKTFHLTCPLLPPL